MDEYQLGTYSSLPNNSLPSVLFCLLDDFLTLFYLGSPVSIPHSHLLQPPPSLILLLLPETLGCCCLLGNSDYPVWFGKAIYDQMCTNKLILQVKTNLKHI